MQREQLYNPARQVKLVGPEAALPAQAAKTEKPDMNDASHKQHGLRGPAAGG